MVLEDVEELRGGARRAADAEQGEGRVPHAQDARELEAGAALHVPLAAEDEHHVQPHVVEAVRPILGHPDPRVLVHELLFEVEHVRVVGGGPHVQVSTVHLGVGSRAAANLQMYGAVV